MAEIEFSDHQNNLAMAKFECSDRFTVAEIEFGDGYNNSAMTKSNNFDADTASKFSSWHRKGEKQKCSSSSEVAK